MSEQDGTQATTKPRRSRQTSKQNGTQKAALQRPTNDDKEAWHAYWKFLGQPWRLEPEIDTMRQEYLSERLTIMPNWSQGFVSKRLTITPDWSQGIDPFMGIKLSRADIEWLLATHENGRGPVNWCDESQRERDGLNLAGADLWRVNLASLPLAKTDLSNAQLEGAFLAFVQLEKANLSRAKLQEAHLLVAELQGADLSGAKLEKALLIEAQLQGANLTGAQLQGVNLSNVTLADAHHIGPQLADVQWGDTNLTVADWEQITMLGDERVAAQKKGRYLRLVDYKAAVRAYRQLSVVLRNQGLNEDAARFTYRSQIMQRKVFWYQRKIGQYLFSLFLDLLAGYGYKPGRSFLAYAFVIGTFAALYFYLGTHLAWNEAIVISMTAFHGRGFFPDQFHPGDPQALVAALEAFVGLLIEVTFIATLTQRLFGK